MDISQTTSRLSRGEGSLAYSTLGSGPLVVCVPGMGDIQSSYRFLAPALAWMGRTAVTMDLRGHGDSDATFSAYDDAALANDLIALVEYLGKPATIVGNSMGAGAAVMVAAQRPDLVSGLVLLGPFVRDPHTNAIMKVLFRIAGAPLWVAKVWRSLLPGLYTGRKPDDFESYLGDVYAAMARPGHARAFSRTMRTSHSAAELSAPGVTAPALILMGALDPDFPDPRAEAEWIASQFPAEIVMLDDCGHYPQSQQPELVTDAITNFFAKLEHA